MPNYYLRIAALSMLAGFIPFVGLASESPIDRSFNALQQWVETERIISREQADWDVEKATIEDLITIYTDELTLLNERIERAIEATSAADAARVELEEQREQLAEIQNRIRRGVEADEARIRILVQYFPPPLRQELRPLINRLPQPGDDGRLSLSQRMQNIVGILGQADNFNNAVTPVSETREFPDGTVAVDTLYFGLGIAYYVDGSGEHAGIGVPSSDGWSWEQRPELAESITQLIAIYRKSAMATYVSLPAELTDIKR